MEKEKLKGEIIAIFKWYDENRESSIDGFVQEIMYVVEQYIKEQSELVKDEFLEDCENNSKRAQKTLVNSIKDWLTEDWDK